MTKTIRFQIYDENSAPLPGLDLAFDDAGAFYLVDGVTPGTLPTVSAVTGATGWYEVPVTLATDERLVARLALGATAIAPYLDLDIAESDPDFRAAPTVEEIDAQLAASHGPDAWGPGGAGAQAVTLTALDAEDGPLSGVRIDVLDGAGAMKASGVTDTSGELQLLLDAGEYSARATLGGYSFAATEIVVSAPDTVAPTSIVGAALPPPSSGSVVGLLLALDLAPTATPYVDGVSGLVAGDTIVLARTAANVPASRAVTRVRATWKRPGDELDLDTTAVVALAITTAVSAAGQITNAGAGGTAAWTLTLTPGQSLAIAAAGATAYDLQVTYDDDSVRTPEVGTWDVLAGRTSTTP